MSMNLKEAREIAAMWRMQNKLLNKGVDPELSKLAQATVLLDDQVTELEAQRDKLLKAARWSYTGCKN